MPRFDVRRVFTRRKLERAGLTVVAVAGAATIAVRGPLMKRSAPEPMTELLARAAAPTGAVARVELREAVSNARWDLPNLEHELVDKWVARFSGALKPSLAGDLRRMDRYHAMIARKAEARGMPTDLVYLAMIESGGLPTAKSPVKARGLWQFMSATARQYGLTVRGRRDDRIDPARSTDAALDYLGDLHAQFGSWYLAAAAYNSGAGRVSRVLRQVTGRETGTDADFYRIADRLPAETRNYVPKLIAVARIAKEPARYGFTVADLAAAEPAPRTVPKRAVAKRAAAKRAAAKQAQRARAKRTARRAA